MKSSQQSRISIKISNLKCMSEEEKKEKWRLYHKNYREKNKEALKLRRIKREIENPRVLTPEKIEKEKAYQKEYQKKYRQEKKDDKLHNGR